MLGAVSGEIPLVALVLSNTREQREKPRNFLFIFLVDHFGLWVVIAPLQPTEHDYIDWLWLWLSENVPNVAEYCYVDICKRHKRNGMRQLSSIFSFLLFYYYQQLVSYGPATSICMCALDEECSFRQNFGNHMSSSGVNDFGQK